MDNLFQNCHPKMNDGRLYRDNKTATRRNEQIKFVNGVSRDDEYRSMLQQNGVAIMQRTAAYYDRACTAPCVHTGYSSRVSPAQMAEQLNRYNTRDQANPLNKCESQEPYRMTQY